MPYLKAITTPGFWLAQKLPCFTGTYHNSCKEATGHQEIVLTALDATSITSSQDVIQTSRNNKEIFAGLFRHAAGLNG